MLHDVATNPKLTADVRVVPFMIQIRRWPVELFCQRMSDLPSPLKSPEPAMFQGISTVPKFTLLTKVVPFMIQIARAIGPSVRSTRSFISPAALFVKVIASTSFGFTPQAVSRCATR